MIWIALGLVGITALADAITTLRAIAEGRREMNPVLAWLFARMNPALALGITKAVLVAACVGAALTWPDSAAPIVGMMIVSVMQAGAAMLNLRS